MAFVSSGQKSTDSTIEVLGQYSRRTWKAGWAACKEETGGASVLDEMDGDGNARVVKMVQSELIVSVFTSARLMLLEPRLSSTTRMPTGGNFLAKMGCINIRASPVDKLTCVRPVGVKNGVHNCRASCCREHAIPEANHAPGRHQVFDAGSLGVPSTLNWRHVEHFSLTA